MNEENTSSPQSIDDRQQPPPQLNEPSIVEPTPSAEPITEPEILTTHNLQPTTSSNMEVHHHTHDPAAPHHKKNWKSYFWEFLMLFLAITLGFIVENQREHYIEHKRAKDYAISLMEEVAGDTIALSQSISYYKTKTESIDTLVGLLAGNIKQIPGGTLYYFADMSMYNNQMVFNKTTIQQLINSGVLRYFSNRKLVKCIGEYDQVLQKVENSGISAQTISLEARKLQFKIFDIKFKNIYGNGQSLNSVSSDSILLIKETPFPLITYEPAILSEFTSWLNLRRANLKVYMTVNLVEAQNKARELLVLLKNEYNLK